MCSICDGSMELPEGEFPCQEQLIKFGKFLYTQAGETFTLISALQTIGAIPLPDTPEKEAVWVSLTLGLRNARAEQYHEEKQRQKKEKISSLVIAGIFTVFGAGLGYVLGQLHTWF